MSQLVDFDIISIPKNEMLTMIFFEGKLVKMFTDSKTIQCRRSHTIQDDTSMSVYRIYNTSKGMDITITNTLEKGLFLSTTNVILSEDGEHIRSYDSTRPETHFDITIKYPIEIDWGKAFLNYSNTDVRVSNKPGIKSILDSFHQSTKVITNRLTDLIKLAQTLKAINNEYSTFMSFTVPSTNDKNEEDDEENETGEDSTVISASHAEVLLKCFNHLNEKDNNLAASIIESGVTTNEPLNLDIYRDPKAIVDQYTNLDLYVIVSKQSLAIVYINQTSKKKLGDEFKLYMSALYCNQMEQIIRTIYENYTSTLLIWGDELNQMYGTGTTIFPHVYEYANAIVKRRRRFTHDKKVIAETEYDQAILNLPEIEKTNHALKSIFILADLLQYYTTVIDIKELDLKHYKTEDVRVNCVKNYLKFCESYLLPYYTFKVMLLLNYKLGVEYLPLDIFANVKQSIQEVAEDSITQKDVKLTYNTRYYRLYNIYHDNLIKVIFYTALFVVVGIFIIKKIK